MIHQIHIQTTTGDPYWLTHANPFQQKHHHIGLALNDYHLSTHKSKQVVSALASWIFQVKLLVPHIFHFQHIFDRIESNLVYIFWNFTDLTIINLFLFRI